MIVFSGGIPRELIRNVTEIFIEAKGKIEIPKVFNKLIKFYRGSTFDIITTWKVIFNKKIYDFRKEIKFSNIEEEIKMTIIETIDKFVIEDLYKNKINIVDEINTIYYKKVKNTSQISKFLSS